MVHTLRDADYRTGGVAGEHEGEPMHGSLHARPYSERKGLLLTNKGIASLYIMDREPLLRTRFTDLYALLKEIERNNSVRPASDTTWLDYALDKGYYEEWQ